MSSSCLTEYSNSRNDIRVVINNSDMVSKLSVIFFPCTLWVAKGRRQVALPESGSLPSVLSTLDKEALCQVFF
jgi:hypothetical protein